MIDHVYTVYRSGGMGDFVSIRTSLISMVSSRLGKTSPTPRHPQPLKGFQQPLEIQCIPLKAIPKTPRADALSLSSKALPTRCLRSLVRVESLLHLFNHFYSSDDRGRESGFIQVTAGGKRTIKDSKKRQHTLNIYY